MDIAANLIARQFPDLAPVTVAPLGVGWDNVAYLVNEAFVFRFPRRAIAVPLLDVESRFLPRIAPWVTLSIPVPQFVGVPEADYAYPFVGYPILPGTTACRIRWTGALRASCAAPLGSFLRTLHAVPPGDPALAPGDVIERANVAARTVKLLERLEEVARTVPDLDTSVLSETVRRLAGTPLLSGTPSWVHGDLYARHLLIDGGHRPCGVIDWGDMHLGDPALDLSLAFSFLPAEARAAFRDAYGPVDASTWDRARFRGISYGALLTLYGRDVGDGAIRDAGMYALRHAAC